MLCIIKVPEYRHRIIVPIPLFLVDEILDIGVTILGLINRKHLPRELHNGQVQGIFKAVCGAWREIRRAGSFTLVDVQSGGTCVSIRLI